ncbi:hypothetical protein COHA_004488 [Chlorella ohadii]|uniref:Lipoprotein n=1 Tax=Chlorella ohadii TaxID=2649997 RepID=A0AAD5DRU4_9CHLO|nr:hypothetical protein COHA_004488 [Chlorella ohadii]
MKSQLLQLGSRLLLLVLLVATGCSGSEFQDGDFVPASRRAQFHAQRTHWHDILGQHCPKFGVKRLVAVPLPQPTGLKVADDYKVQFSFDGDRHLTPWLSIIGKRAASPPYVEVELTRSGNTITSVTAEVFELDSEDQKEHAQLITGAPCCTCLLTCLPSPCHCAAAAFAALLLGLNVARTYQQRLRQFLSDIAGESGSSLAAAAGTAKAD